MNNSINQSIGRLVGRSAGQSIKVSQIQSVKSNQLKYIYNVSQNKVRHRVFVMTSSNTD